MTEHETGALQGTRVTEPVRGRMERPKTVRGALDAAVTARKVTAADRERALTAY